MKGNKGSKGIFLQQGDVLCEQIKELPPQLRRSRQKGPVILRRGEATGHVHEIKNPRGVEVYHHDGAMLLKLSRQATVVHPEHRAVTLTPGLWRVRIVREFDNFRNVERNVRD